MGKEFEIFTALVSRELYPSKPGVPGSTLVVVPFYVAYPTFSPALAGFFYLLLFRCGAKIFGQIISAKYFWQQPLFLVTLYGGLYLQKCRFVGRLANQVVANG